MYAYVYIFIHLFISDIKTRREMPRKRATKGGTGQRAQPKKPEGSLGGDMEKEAKRERILAFINDFDLESMYVAGFES